MRLPKKGIQYGTAIGCFLLVFVLSAILELTEVIRNVDTNRRHNANAALVTFN
jgi:hypothetical protein